MKTKKLTITLTEDVYARFQYLCVMCGQNKGEVIADFVQGYVEADTAENRWVDQRLREMRLSHIEYAKYVKKIDEEMKRSQEEEKFKDLKQIGQT
jgi:hypothetical protein